MQVSGTAWGGDMGVSTRMMPPIVRRFVMPALAAFGILGAGPAAAAVPLAAGVLAISPNGEVAALSPQTGGEQDTAAALAAARAEIAAQRAQIAQQQREIAAQEQRLDAQAARLDELEQKLAGVANTTQQVRDEVAASRAAPAGGAAAPATAVAAQTVGQPDESEQPPQISVLDDQGRVVTPKGQLVAEFGLDYARADRNRAVFRGVELIQSILVGVFDINESRQDVLTASGALRYGLADRLEVGVRVPYVYRADHSVLVPIAGSTNNDAARSVDSSTSGGSIGDIEMSARYQLNNGGPGRPYLIANLQADAPTGRSPFAVKRDANGAALQSATGSGFWSVSPSLTMILPSEPAVLFGTIGYTFNFAKNVNTRIPPVQIDRIEPGNEINVSAGIGIAVNQRTSFNLGYAHTWAFGTRSITRTLDTRTNLPTGDPIKTRSRDLQLGRLLFGVSYRLNNRTTLNWSIEAGLTEDAPDVRTSLRIPFRL